jgi:hypothetical protein
MTTLNFASQALRKLKGIKLPAINRARLSKFFNEAFLDIHDEDLHNYQEPKLKTKD